MKSKILLIIAIATAFYLSSCSSDNNTNNPTPTGDYYKLAANNYWVYTTKNTDPETNDITTTTDSTIIISQEVKEGKNAFKLKTFTDGEDSQESYQYSENGVLYTMLDDFLPDDGLIQLPDNQITNTWIKIADPNASNWEILNFTLTDIPVNLGEIEVTASGTLKLSATKGDKVIINVLGKDYTAQKYTINTVINAKVNGVDIPTVTIPTHFYYADGIGLVKTQTESTEISLLFAKIKTPASESILIRHNIK